MYPPASARSNATGRIIVVCVPPRPCSVTISGAFMSVLTFDDTKSAYGISSLVSAKWCMRICTRGSTGIGPRPRPGAGGVCALGAGCGTVSCARSAVAFQASTPPINSATRRTNRSKTVECPRICNSPGEWNAASRVAANIPNVNRECSICALGIKRAGEISACPGQRSESRGLRLEERRRPYGRCEPLVIFEHRRQLRSQPETARIVVEASMPVEFQVVLDFERRQRGDHLRGERRESRHDRERQRRDELRLHDDERHAQHVRRVDADLAPNLAALDEALEHFEAAALGVDDDML